MAVECYEVIASGIAGGQFVQNVFHVNVTVSGSPDPFTTADAICAKFCASGEFVEKFTDALASDYGCTSLRARRVLPSGGPTQIYLGASMSQTEGQRSGGIGASQVAPLIIWITATNPSKTGRTFIPALSETDIDENHLTSGVLTALGAFGTYFAAGGTLAGAIPWDAAILRRVGGTADGIANFRVSPVIGTQRRRLHPV